MTDRSWDADSSSFSSPLSSPSWASARCSSTQRVLTPGPWRVRSGRRVRRTAAGPFGDVPQGRRRRQDDRLHEGADQRTSGRSAHPGHRETSTLLAVSDIQPGEYVLAARFGQTPVGTKAINVPAGQVAVSLQLGDPARVGSFVTPGSRVVLFDSFDAPAGSTDTGKSTRVLLDDVLVIAIGQTSLTPVASDAGAPAPVAESGALMTVAVTPADALHLVHGNQTGQIYGSSRHRREGRPRQGRHPDLPLQQVGRT